MEQSPSRRRPRLLLNAFACAPNRGSEPGVGWNRALQAARFCDVWVLCEEKLYAAPIRDYLARQGPIPGLEFVSVPRSRLQLLMDRTALFGYTSYRIWQQTALTIARRLHAEIGFDLVHQVTFCGYREPGLLWKLGIPFVWGPVGGTQNFPWSFIGYTGLRYGTGEAIRNVLNSIQLRCSLAVRRALRHSAAFLAANTTVQADFARVHGITPLLQLETGLRSVADQPRPPRTPGQPLRLLWSGEFLPRKALSLLLRAVARMPADVKWQLRVLGRGKKERLLHRLAARLGITGSVEFLGHLPHAEAIAQSQWADAFVFTSLRDTSGNVVLEAMSAGVPIVCLDHQGVHDMVTPDCGLKIPVTSPSEVIARLTDALVRLAREPGLLEQLGAAALERARYYLWDRQGERMCEVYRHILGEHFLWEPRAIRPS